MSLEPVIRLQHVVKRYGKQIALDHISLEVPPGVVFALLGENGAGKTTAIRILLGLVEADAGSATVLGLNSQRDGIAIRQSVGYVSERPALDEWMTVEEMGWFSAGFHAAGFLENYRRHAANFGLQPNKKLKQLSKGMRSKVALSLALSHDPRLLILDEPTSGLDTMVRREFLESMVEFTSDGKTVFLSSHQIHEVERVADMVAIVRHGKILCCRGLDDLKQHTTEATVTLNDEQAAWELPGPVLTSRRRGRQCQLTVAADETTTRTLLEGLPRIERFDLRRPALEDIFVAYMHSPSDDSESTVARFGARGGPPMNTSITQRWFWREYRLGRSFWIAMFALTVTLELFWLASNAYWNFDTSRHALWGIAIVMPMVYVLGWAATSFSREHETGSFAMLTTLPTTFTPVWLGKVGFTLVSGLLLAIALAVVTILLGATPKLDALGSSLWVHWLVAGVATFCSQWIKRPLTSTFVAGGILGVSSLWPTNSSMTIEAQLTWLNQGVLFLIGAFAFVGSYPQTKPWLQDRLRWSLPWHARSRVASVTGPCAAGNWRQQVGYWPGCRGGGWGPWPR